MQGPYPDGEPVRIAAELERKEANSQLEASTMWVVIPRIEVGCQVRCAMQEHERQIDAKSDDVLLGAAEMTHYEDKAPSQEYSQGSEKV